MEVNLHIPPPFGPHYPTMPAAVQKHRRVAARAGSVAAMGKAERQAYGAAVEQAILSLQRAAFTRAYAPPPANCASGTFANTADAIEKAVRARQARELAAACRQDREGRSDATVQALYDAAMAAKRKGLNSCNIS